MDFEAQSIELRENLETTEGRNVQLGVEQMDLRSQCPSSLQLERTSNALAEATEKISTLESDTRSLAKGLGESKRTEEKYADRLLRVVVMKRKGILTPCLAAASLRSTKACRMKWLR
eukprot:1758914-Rhodomonas_salina.1